MMASSSLSSLSPSPVEAEQSEDANDADFQGPHNHWRKRLRPVRQLSPDKPREDEEAAGRRNADAGSSPKSGRKFTREDRVDENRIREKLKAMPSWKKDLIEKKRKGPLIAKHSNALTIGSTNQNNSSSISDILKRRSLNHGTESAFTQQVVNNGPLSPGPGLPRRRISPSNSFRSHHQSAGILAGNSEVTRKRIEKVQRARLYLLQQTGPNSFLIGGDSPIHKFKVIIGPQTCSCGRGPHCVHVLFVMLRVFQVKETESCLWGKTLKNYEVENLFRIYHEKRTSLLAKKELGKRTQRKPAEERPENSTQEKLTVPAESDTGSSKDDDDTCPICLLEMLEGESLLKCENGCQNRLHHHCITVWFEECHRQSDPLICPICRAKWKSKVSVDAVSTITNETPRGRENSSTPLLVQDDFRLPYAEPIPTEHMNTARPWIQVLGEDLVCCLFSRNWSIRETALKHLSCELVSTLLRGSGEGRSGALISSSQQAATHQMLECFCSVLAYMCADPVYKVFVSCLRTLRAMLAYVPCRDEQQRSRLQIILKPVINTILIKCTDGNRRTSQLSLSTIVELAKGQHGELAVGREIVSPGTGGLGGICYMLKCVLEDYHPSTVQWQWLLGRFYVLDRLLEEFPSKFIIQEPRPSHSINNDAVNTENSCLINVAMFALNGIGNSHTRIAKIARRIFFLCVKFAAAIDSIITELDNLLTKLEPKLMRPMRRKLDRIVDEFHLSERIVEELRLGSESSQSTSCVGTSPSASPNETPLSTPPNSPFPAPSTSDSPQTEGLSPVPCVDEDVAGGITIVSSNLDEGNEANVPPISASQIDILTPPYTPEHTAGRIAPVNPLPEVNLSEASLSSPITGSLERLAEESATNREKTFVLCDAEDSSGSQHRSPVQSEVQEGESGHDCSLAGPGKKETDLSSGQSSSTLLTEDLSDLTSPLSSEPSVSFKTEVTTPKGSPSHTAERAFPGDVAEQYCCKEEVELEEAVALAKALEASSKQEPCPQVPGLTPSDKEEVITIRIQPEIFVTPSQNESQNSSATSTCSQNLLYLENIHWVRGPLLGTGAYSTCHQSRDVKTGTLMAVKQIAFCRNTSDEQEKVIEAVTEEIHMMAKLNHPNVVRIMGATRQGCHFNMFVEWMPGGSVSYLLGKYGAFSENVVVNYTQQVLRGLTYLHDNHVLHRDLKGANLLVDSTGQRIRIGDFGAAARLASQTTGAGEFQGQLLGTIAFMAPEVLRGENYGRACDVWSVGCAIVEMITTKPPWNANDISNHLALIFRIASSVSPPPIPDKLSPPLKDLMLRCLEVNAEFRPPAKELLMHPLFMLGHR